MEAALIKKTLTDFAKSIGPRAYVSTIVSSSGPENVALSIYPDGISRDSALYVQASDWDGALTAMREQWAARRDEYRRKTIRKMALEIIRITAELGECTDAALRAGEFTPEEVVQFGAEAIADANTIASNGPFAIVPAAKANAA